MSLGDILDGVATALLPPMDADPRHVYRWRLAFAGLTIVNSMSLAAHIGLACGFLPGLYPGFALANDLKSQQMQLTSIQASQIDNMIFQLRQKQCEALKSGNAAASNALALIIRERQDLYREVTKRDYSLLPCDVL